LPALLHEPPVKHRSKLRRTKAFTPFDRASVTQKLKQLWALIALPINHEQFFLIYFGFSSLSLHGVATPPNGVSPCSSLQEFERA